MQVYIYINGEARGPYSEERVRTNLSDGTFKLSDLWLRAGDSEWNPLSTFDAATEEPRAPAPPPLSSVVAPRAPVVAPVPQPRPTPDAGTLGGYARSTLQPNEKPIYRTSIHWIVFAKYSGIMLLVVLFLAIPFAVLVQAVIGSRLGWAVLPLSLFVLVPPFVTYYTSELVITDTRVLIKLGFIERQTLEMFISKIESVGVSQGVTGRLLDYGTVIIKGTGGSEEPFQTIAHPLEFRNCVQRIQRENESRDRRP